MNPRLLCSLFVSLAIGFVCSLSGQTPPSSEVEQKPILYVLAAQIDTKVLARGETPNSREARLLAKLLTERSGGFYSAIKTRVLFGEDASRENILNGFHWLQSNMKEHDVAIVFIAGHGSYNEKQQLYAYHPIGGAIKGMEFRHAFDKMSGRKVLFLQTCHASGVLETTRGQMPFQKTMVICACDDDEESTKLMGRVMINGLAKLGCDPSGVVTTQSLAHWIELRVPLVSKGKQNVQIGRAPRFTDFPLAPKGELIDPNLTGQF